MLYRKIEKRIENHFKSKNNKILLVSGARQVGKTYIIRHVGKKLFKNYIELNFAEDAAGEALFKDVRTIENFYMQVSTIAGNKMKKKADTLIFLDEIQQYPHILTLLKFLKQDDRYTYVASGSLLGVTLRKTTSIPIGSIERLEMSPLDFEEFLIANGFGNTAIEMMQEKYQQNESLDEAMHQRVMDLFKKYLLVGGMPDAVNEFLETRNMMRVRKIQDDIHGFYADDASKYENEAAKQLKIKRIFEMIPSNLENKKKRVVAQRIENKKGKRFSDYQDEFEYLISAGIALEVRAVANPVFPLIESVEKNLLKLYLNDVGILTGILYRGNIRAVIDDERSINLGTVYESVVAQELKAHGFKLCYYDNRSKGEVDYLIDDYDRLSVLPIEVKSGKDYSVHSALTHFVTNEDYRIKRGIVLSNERRVLQKGNIVYMPIYYVMFIQPNEKEYTF